MLSYYFLYMRVDMQAVYELLHSKLQNLPRTLRHKHAEDFFKIEKQTGQQAWSCPVLAPGLFKYGVACYIRARCTAQMQRHLSAYTPGRALPQCPRARD